MSRSIVGSAARPLPQPRRAIGDASLIAPFDYTSMLWARKLAKQAPIAIEQIKTVSATGANLANGGEVLRVRVEVLRVAVGHDELLEAQGRRPAVTAGSQCPTAPASTM